MSNNVNQSSGNIEPQYHYDPEAAKAAAAPENVAAPKVGEDGLLPAVDVAVPSATDIPKASKLPPPDEPSLVVRSGKAIQKEAVKRQQVTDVQTKDMRNAQVTEAQKKAAQLTGAPMKAAPSKDSQGNPWIAQPSSICDFNDVMYKVAKNLSSGKQLEAEKQRNFDKAIFELGMESAQLAEKSRLQESNKELFKACSELTSAISSTGQLVGTIGAKGAAEAQAEGEWGTKVTDQKAKVDALKTRIEDEVIATDASAAGGRASPGFEEALKNRLTDKSNPLVAEYDKESAELSKLKGLKQDAYKIALEEAQKKVDTKAQITTQTVQAVASFASTTATKEQAVIEKNKQENEAIIGYLNKSRDSAAKAKDDQANDLNKVLQSIERTGETRTKIQQLRPG